MGAKAKGFTLIELLVVIAIIGMLAAVILASLASAREKSKIANALAQIHELRNAVLLYYDDTGQYPAECELACTAATDPMQNALGVPKWKGPYFSRPIWSLVSPWGGQVGFVYRDFGTGVAEFAIRYNDDAASTDNSNNCCAIPLASMIAIDKAIDDGDLSIGGMIGNNLGPPNTSAIGEFNVRVKF